MTLIYLHLSDVISVVSSCIQFGLDFLESVESIINILHRMGRGGHYAEDYHALGYHRIYDHRAENLIILAQVLCHLGRLGYATENMHGCNTRHRKYARV